MNTFKFKITQVIDRDVSIKKFDDDAVRLHVLSNSAAINAIVSDMAVIFICLENLKENKNDSCTSKGTTYHTIIVPHEKVVANSTEEVTLLCVELTVERLLQWAEKKQKKATRARRMKAAA